MDRYKLSYLGLFGSVAREEDGPKSDVDILVEFREPVGSEFIALAHELEDLLGCRVDLVSRGGMAPKYYAAVAPDLVCLNERPAS